MNLKEKRPGCFIFLNALNTTRAESMTSRPIVRSTVLICGLVAMLMLQGCLAGPKFYQGSFNEYNDAVRKTSDGQMLANLVRMRYYESPVFLQVASISTSFNLSGNAGASATLNENAMDNYGLSAGAGYSENPTITFSLPESGAYYGRLLAPLSAEQVTSLVLAGFDCELVLLSSVRGINGLKNLNADFESSSEKSLADSKFREAIGLIKKLRSEGIVDLELGGKETSWSSPVTIDATGDISQVLLLGAASYAMSNDAEIVSYPNKQWQMHRYEKHMALRFSPAADDSSDAQRLKKLLGLKADRYNFPIVEAEMVNAEKARGVLGQSPGALDPSVVWVELGMRGRSMMEIMQVASKEIQVPGKDVELGTVSANGKSVWLNIKSSKDEPGNASLRIKSRDYWFYIEDNDLKSRESFAMLTALFAVVGGTVPGAHPVLTLPVGR